MLSVTDETKYDITITTKNETTIEITNNDGLLLDKCLVKEKINKIIGKCKIYKV